MGFLNYGLVLNILLTTYHSTFLQGRLFTWRALWTKVYFFMAGYLFIQFMHFYPFQFPPQPDSICCLSFSDPLPIVWSSPNPPVWFEWPSFLFVVAIFYCLPCRAFTHSSADGQLAGFRVLAVGSSVAMALRKLCVFPLRDFIGYTPRSGITGMR